MKGQPRAATAGLAEAVVVLHRHVVAGDRHQTAVADPAEQALVETVENGAAREDIQQLLPAGGARNAVDCAMWDLECKRSGMSIWELTGQNLHFTASMVT